MPRTDAERGRIGLCSNCMPVSLRDLFPFFKLQDRQALTTFSQIVRPPSDLGMMWSMVIRSPPFRPQYWQV